MLNNSHSEILMIRSDLNFHFHHWPFILISRVSTHVCMTITHYFHLMFLSAHWWCSSQTNLDLTPLMGACISGQADITKLLLDRRAAVDYHTEVQSLAVA